MRTFVMNDLASFWDAFGSGNAKNTFLYKPENDRWRLMSWDFDVGLGVFNDPPDAGLLDVGDPAVQKMYRTPAFLRRYWAAIEESLDGFFRVGAGTRIDAFLDATYAAFRANGVALASPAAIKTWIGQRRTFLQAQLARVRAPLAITSRAGKDFATNAPNVTLTGTAPVGARFLTVNGSVCDVAWTTVTNWSLAVALLPGVNDLRIGAVDRTGAILSAGEVRNGVTYGEPVRPITVVASRVPGTGVIELGWDTIAGVDYVVETRDVPGEGSPWQALAPAIRAGSARTSFRLAPADDPRRERYFRIRENR